MGLAVGLAAAGCSDADTSPATTIGNTVASGSEVTEPKVTVALADLDLGLSKVVSGLDSPVAAISRPGDETGLYLVQQSGEMVRIDVSKPGKPEAVIDINAMIQFGGEQGFLGAEFDDTGDTLYLSYSRRDSGQTVLSAVAMDGNEASGDPVEFFTLYQLFPNHNGGTIVRGPDGYLWFGLGDGGLAGDPEKNGQNPKTLLGSMLRIDPKPLAEMGDADVGYDIPDDNPFASGAFENADGSSVTGAPEVWLYGVRNPWKFSFDSVTDDLWIADVGQGDWEELDYLPAAGGTGRGANLGWALREGTHPYPPDAADGPSGTVFVEPIHEYSHKDGGCSVTGGQVYRGEAIPALAGTYLFGDFCKPTVWGIGPDGDATDLGIEVTSMSGAGTGPDGEMYLISYTGTIFKLVEG